MKKNSELANFNTAMDTILRADPQVVKAQMKAEKSQRAAKRKAKQTPFASVHASTAKD
jgi:hypothetical protein